jgi:hypothetical protein
MKLPYKDRNKVIDKKKTIRFSNFEMDLIQKNAKELKVSYGKFVRHAVMMYMIAIELNKKGDVKTSPGTKF